MGVWIRECFSVRGVRVIIYEVFFSPRKKCSLNHQAIDSYYILSNRTYLVFICFHESHKVPSVTGIWCVGGGGDSLKTCAVCSANFPSSSLSDFGQAAILCQLYSADSCLHFHAATERSHPFPVVNPVFCRGLPE